MEGLSLGFDLRLRASDYVEEVWSSKHRTLYLLREDVKWPLSVDRAVWPSLLQLHYFDAVAHRKTNPRFLGQAASDLENELGFLTDLASIAPFAGARDGVGIAIQLIYNERREADPFIGVEASAVPAGADILGFDVATPAPISGLCNCAYDLSEVHRLRAEWGPKLNVHGLLKSVDDAMRFREMTNKRVPEHAPFYVYKLFGVKLGS